MKLTAKQEKFAQEIAKGKTQSDAYRASYNIKNTKDKSINELASVLANDIKIISRVKDLSQKALKHVEYDIEAHYKELEEIRQLALHPETIFDKKELSSAIKATELKGKLKGFYTEQVKHSGEIDNNIIIDFK